MRNNSSDISVKKVQNPVVKPLKTDAEFVNSIAEKIGLRPPQIMAHFSEPLQSPITFVLHFRG